MPTHSEVEVNLKKKSWERSDAMKRLSLARPQRKWKACKLRLNTGGQPSGCGQSLLICAYRIHLIFTLVDVKTDFRFLEVSSTVLILHQASLPQGTYC